MISDPGQENMSSPGIRPVDYLRPPSSGRQTASAARILMVVAALFAIALAAVCLFNPILEIAPVLGGGTLGTPMAPVYQSDAGRDKHAPTRYIAEAAE
jgi:hypothetical protein